MANTWLPRAIVTYLGVKAEEEVPVPMTSRPEQILMLGRMSSLERYKGHDQVLDAWPGVLAACPAARLVIVGDGDDRGRLREKARDLPGVAFAGFLPQGALRSMLRESRLLVAPSTSEGFGLNAIEAAMQGTPVLGLRGSVLEELFPGSGVELVANQEPTTIAAGILRILRDPSRAQAKGDMVRRAALIHYTDERAVARIRPTLNRWLT
jgi:phosphatidylinositol alpha-1,6-mannosyltransferase